MNTMAADTTKNKNTSIKKSPALRRRFFALGALVAFLFTLSMLVSCKGKTNQIEVTVEINKAEIPIDKCGDILKQRLENLFGAEDMKVTVNGSQITLSFAVSKDDSLLQYRLTRALQHNGNALEFCEVYSNREMLDYFLKMSAAIRTELGDSAAIALINSSESGKRKVDVQGTQTQSKISGMLQNKEAEDEYKRERDSLMLRQLLFIHIQLAGLSGPQQLSKTAEAGIVRLEDTAIVMKLLNMKSARAARPSTLVFCWASNAEEMSKGQYIKLYAIKRQQGRGALSGDIIDKVAMGFDENSGSPKVSIEFNEYGKKRFAEITRKMTQAEFASGNASPGGDGNFLAIVFDDKVYAAPRVVSEIPGGKIDISGSFTIAEAEELNAVLRAYSPFSSNIISFRKTKITE